MTVKSNDFAKNVMKITNKPAVHTVPVENAIAAMQEEVERLKNELQKFNEAVIEKACVRCFSTDISLVFFL